MNARWIWISPVQKDDYLRFRKNYVGAHAVIRIACETDYALYLNGELVYTGQYAAPYGSVAYDEIPLCGNDGCNSLEIVARHLGIGSSVYRPGAAGLWYEVRRDGEVLVCSAAGDPVSRAGEYVPTGYNVTYQLGRSVRFDFTRGDVPLGGAVAADRPAGERLIARPIPRCLLEPVSGRVVAQGRYRPARASTPAQEAQFAWLSARPFADLFGLPREEGDRLAGPLNVPGRSYVVLDLGRESSGYLRFRVTTRSGARLVIGYGEHLCDLRPRAAVMGRNFAFSYVLGEGSTAFVQPFHRLGCRYLILLTDRAIGLEDLSLLASVYPAQPLEFRLSDRLHQRIYDTAVRTNLLCMHVHPEDCPWREQAMYGMDARNQLLYGYHMFADRDFARESLRLMLSTRRPDGLFELCAPSQIATTIPAFSLFTVLAVSDYCACTGDRDFCREALPALRATADAFLARREGDLMPRFFERQYWNFYEWTPGLDGGDIFRSRDQEKILDLPLNAIAAMALRALHGLCAWLGEEDGYGDAAGALVRRAEEVFYSPEQGAYAAFFHQGERWGYYELSQVLMLAVSDRRRRALADSILERRFPASTVAFAGIKYDALLAYDPALIGWVLDEIEDVYGTMVLEGATSFYETVKGERDFEDGGSMCHAWASVPGYVYRKYLTDKDGGEAACAPARVRVLHAQTMLHGRKDEST